MVDDLPRKQEVVGSSPAASDQNFIDLLWIEFSMKEYSFTYRFDNKLWSVSIYADSEEEAKRKFWALSENGQYEGEIIS